MDANAGAGPAQVALMSAALLPRDPASPAFSGSVFLPAWRAGDWTHFLVPAVIVSELPAPLPTWESPFPLRCSPLLSLPRAWKVTVASTQDCPLSGREPCLQGRGAEVEHTS